MRNLCYLLICFVITSLSVHAQDKPASHEIKTVSLEQFNTLVDRCIAVLRTKPALTMSEQEHIATIMCVNTVTFTLDNNRKRIYTQGRYLQLEQAVREKNYLKEVMKAYPDSFTKGMGIYFPKLKMEFYGSPSAKYLYKII